MHTKIHNPRCTAHIIGEIPLLRKPLGKPDQMCCLSIEGDAYLSHYQIMKSVYAHVQSLHPLA